MCLFLQREFLRPHLKFRLWVCPSHLLCSQGPSPPTRLLALATQVAPNVMEVPEGRTGALPHWRVRAAIAANLVFLCPFSPKDGMNWVCRNVSAKKK